jgi:hypothetical protein
MNIKTTTNYLHFEIAVNYFKICKMRKILYKTAPLKNPWGRLGHVEIYNKVDYFWNFEYVIFY